MKIIKGLNLDKYKNWQRYSLIENYIYKDNTGGVGSDIGLSNTPVYCITLYCELEENEDMQYPLENVLDKYLVNCTDFMEERKEKGKHIFVFEIEGKYLDSIRKIADLIGKRVFNYEENGYVNLGIE